MKAKTSIFSRECNAYFDFESQIIFSEGIFHAENEKWEQAEAAFKASQEILPGRASTVSNLLGVLVAKKYDEAWL